jgi:excisionase family DNA binding protein
MAVASPVAPTERDRKEIEELSHALESMRADHARILIDGATSESLAVPRPVFEVLKLVADQMGKGRAVSIVPVGMILSTQQAAELLGASRQHVVKLLTDGEIPFEKVGTHRRVRIEDVLAYKRRRQSTREDALARLSDQAERLKLRY